jgi:uncharacterized protein (TIGR04141 family)
MTILPKIFKIDKDHRDLIDIVNTIDVLKKIIRLAYGKFGWPLKKENLELENFEKEGITYFLYLHSVPDKTSEWASFLPEQLKSNTEMFKQTKLSLILFVETEHDIYAVVGGNAYPIIVGVIDHEFGLDIYDRIISIENDEAFSTKSRRIIGQQIGVSEQFRDKYKMINYLQFGKIPKELNIKLDKKTSDEHFDFLLQKPGDRLNISVGKAFRVNKQVSFDVLDQIIRELLVIKGIAPQELLSSYIQVRDKVVIDDLQKQLVNRIYNYIPVLQGTAKNMDAHFEYDFCSPNNIEAFYEAETYQLKEKGKEDKHEIFATLHDKDEIVKVVVLRGYELHGNSEASFLFYLRGVRVHCYTGTKNTTSSGFLFHFNAEFNISREPVFLIDTKWYKLKDAFCKSLASQTSAVLKSTKLQNGILNIPWQKKTNSTSLLDEGEYNEAYDGRIDYFVMDTITPDGIELCDIIYRNGEELMLIHIKHSFTARVRELTNQILISGRRVSEAIATKNRAYFKKVYNSILSKGRSVNSLSESEFADMFFESRITYVFATASQFEDDASISENLSRYTSNIAKFSLTTCSSEVRTLYGDFKTCQIARESLNP